jgi:hypothetical protein
MVENAEYTDSLSTAHRLSGRSGPSGPNATDGRLLSGSDLSGYLFPKKRTTEMVQRSQFQWAPASALTGRGNRFSLQPVRHVTNNSNL